MNVSRLKRTVNILGIRGVPAAHGGFETFAHHLSLFLVKNGWDVNVYCQHNKNDPNSPVHKSEDYWNGVRRIHIVVQGDGPFSTIKFDLACILDVLKRPGVDLVLGYNTAVFTVLQRLYGRRVIMNMDGIEWKRDKWSLPAKVWFWVNELAGLYLCNVPIADHPEIKKHLERFGRKGIEMIPYGSEKITSAPEEHLAAYGIKPGEYAITIARLEPENSILEIVRAYGVQKRNFKLVVLGTLHENNAYHQELKRQATEDVLFPGAIYEEITLNALRYHALAYVHGHQVGGTNPSLVEALGANNVVVAHDNRFNRWVAGDEQLYFKSGQELEHVFSKLSQEHDPHLSLRRQEASERHSEIFIRKIINDHYAQVLDMESHLA
jgi:Domain of unknown function (DUF1972)